MGHPDPHGDTYIENLRDWERAWILTGRDPYPPGLEGRVMAFEVLYSGTEVHSAMKEAIVQADQAGAQVAGAGHIAPPPKILELDWFANPRVCVYDGSEIARERERGYACSGER